MTLGTSNIGMSAFELEGIVIVIEIIKPIHSVMTGNAIIAEREQMGLGEDNIHFAVTGLARVRGEARYIVSVAISTIKRLAVRLLLVPVQ